MKTLVPSDDKNALSGVFTDSDGEPLEHEEWVEVQKREHDRQRKEQERQQGRRSNPNRRGSQDDEGDGDEGDSPVSDSNADEAIEAIGRMRSRDRLQHIVANDKRVSVQKAAQERLDSL